MERVCAGSGDGVMSVKQIVMAAAGLGGAAAPTYIEDVFSTYLYTGNGSTQTITNGIDLSGEGGMTWIKSRSLAYSHRVFDTVRGATKFLVTNDTLAEDTNASTLTSFSSLGFSVGASTAVNENTTTYASWTFRKAPKFFDVVTYTGNGATGRNISHALGSVPGFVVVKLTSTTGNWNCIHRQNGSSWTALQLNSTAAGGSPSASVWGDGVSFIAPTSANFTVGSVANNTNGATYVAYLFAHNAGGFGDDGEQNVISCGSFTTDGSGNATVSLGYEPQYVMYKRSDGTGSWLMFDNMRGMTVNTTNGDAILFANLSDAESTVDWIQPTATGFNPYNIAWNATYIYIAIRRGPMKTPESGTSVYYGETYTGNGAARSFTAAGFPPDLFIADTRTGSSDGPTWGDRLRGANRTLFSVSTDSESTIANRITNFGQNGVSIGDDSSVNQLNNTLIGWNFRRAPGFFDVVCYTGDGAGAGSPQTIYHNLEVAPEFLIIKKRSGTAQNWYVYQSALGNDKTIYLNLTSGVSGSNDYWGYTTPTADYFKVGTAALHQSSETYVAYLFATCPGVSKVGSYTGTAATQQINCGFSGGARFVLVKATSTTGNWLVWDAARGIVAGNDPYLALNSTAAEVTTTDWVDTYSAGFELTSASGNLANTNGVSYIFLAVA